MIEVVKLDLSIKSFLAVLDQGDAWFTELIQFFHWNSTHWNQRWVLIVILLTFFSEFSSSDGQTDSAFGESIISTSPYSTPVAGHLSNRFNQVSTTPDNHGEEADNELRQRSGTDRFRESAEVHAQEEREDEEAGYARLEDICSNQSGQASKQRR